MRSIGNSSYVRLTVLIPIVGYLIIFNAHVVDYLDLAKEFVGAPPTEGSQVSPRLLLIYFGLTAIALGSATYTLACPWQVKHYGTATAYVGGEGPNIGDLAFEPIEEVLRNSRYKTRYQRIRNRYEQDMKPITAEQKAQVNNGVLHLYFEYLDHRYLVWRWVAFVSFVVGFFCLMIPSAQVFYRVLIILLANLRAML